MGKAKPTNVQPNVAVSVLVIWKEDHTGSTLLPGAMGVNARAPIASPSPPSKNCTSYIVDKLQ